MLSLAVGLDLPSCMKAIPLHGPVVTAMGIFRLRDLDGFVDGALDLLGKGWQNLAGRGCLEAGYANRILGDWGGLESCLPSGL